MSTNRRLPKSGSLSDSPKIRHPSANEMKGRDIDEMSESDDPSLTDDQESEDDEYFKNDSPSISYNTSRESKSTFKYAERTSINRNVNISRSPGRPNTSRDHVNLGTKSKGDSQSSWSFITIFLVTLSAFCLYNCIFTNSESIDGSSTVEAENTVQEQQKLVYNAVESIKTKFSNQNSDTWIEIISGIYNVMRDPKQPAVFILYANEGDTINCLAKSIAKASSSVLNGTNYLHLTSKDLAADTGEVIETLRQEVPKRKAVVFQDLLHIHPNALRAFHNLCDRYNPLIEGVIYIMTIVVEEYKESKQKLSFIENHITNVLSNSVESDILGALVARITDGVILPIKPEKYMLNC